MVIPIFKYSYFLQLLNKQIKEIMYNGIFGLLICFDLFLQTDR